MNHFLICTNSSMTDERLAHILEHAEMKGVSKFRKEKPLEADLVAA